MIDPEQENIDDFLITMRSHIKNGTDQARGQAIVQRWQSQWIGKHKSITATHSNHGSYLHFNIFLSNQWCHGFLFRSIPKKGFSLRGPDPDRTRRSHKLKSNRLDSTPLDLLFEDWQSIPHSHAAGNAVEFFLEETPDDIWETCLQAALVRLA